MGAGMPQVASLSLISALLINSSWKDPGGRASVQLCHRFWQRGDVAAQRLAPQFAAQILLPPLPQHPGCCSSTQNYPAPAAPLNQGGFLRPK